MTKAVIFDFFGVISSEVALEWFRKHYPEDPIQTKETFVAPADLGSISFEELLRNMSDSLSLPLEKVREEWKDLARIDIRVVELIKKLRDQYKVALLSDAPSGFLRGILSEYNLESIFDAVLISSEFKTTKRNKDIFIATLADLNIEAPEAIFIDDNYANIAVASSVGIRGIHYDNYELLVANLKSLSIKVD